MTIKEREKQLAIAKSESETLQKARDNSMKQSERLILQVNSFEKELTDRRAKEAQLKTEISTLEQAKRNTLQKENETHEKYIHTNGKLEKEKKLVHELQQTIDRLQTEMQYSANAREDLAERNQTYQQKMSQNDAHVSEIMTKLSTLVLW